MSQNNNNSSQKPSKWTATLSEEEVTLLRVAAGINVPSKSKPSGTVSPDLSDKTSLFDTVDAIDFIYDDDKAYEDQTPSRIWFNTKEDAVTFAQKAGLSVELVEKFPPGDNDYYLPLKLKEMNELFYNTIQKEGNHLTFGSETAAFRFEQFIQKKNPKHSFTAYANNNMKPPLTIAEVSRRSRRWPGLSGLGLNAKTTTTTIRGALTQALTNFSHRIRTLKLPVNHTKPQTDDPRSAKRSSMRPK